MIFQSLQFLLFFVPVFVLNLVLANKVKGNQGRKILLVAASAVFYMTWSVPLAALLLGSIAINYFVGLELHGAAENRRRRWLTLGVSSQLAILALFKYANFGIESAHSLLDGMGIAPSTPVVLDIVLPLGISFYTFQGMSYIIDIYRRHYDPYDSFLDFTLYISFFPQLVAGPIVRADYFRRNLDGPHSRVRLEQVTTGLHLFVWGVFKKSVLADNCAKISDLAFNDPSGVSSLMMLLGIYAFAFQIYLDFSGYTDMARGLGRMLGIDLPINFNLPYLSRGLREFWQRWHISLSTWLRDYLYISLGGSRTTPLKTYRNLLITMLLGGLWHGASFNFVVWGAIHGTLLAAEHAAVGKDERATSNVLWHGLLVFLTFQVTCFAWIFFRAPDTASAMAVLSTLSDVGGYFAFEQLQLFKPQNWLFGLIVPALFVFVGERWMLSNEIDLTIGSPFKRAVAFCSLFFLILLISGKSSEFIYFQF